MVTKNWAFGVMEYEPAFARQEPARKHPVVPDADPDLDVLKNDVFGVDEYAPIDKLQLSSR
jgi:hypothetical protein